MPSTRQGTLQAEVRQHVAPGSALYTDALKSYDGLAPDYAHQVIDHAEAHVRGKVHTNGLENFWSPLKRSIKGTYVSVEPFHLIPLHSMNRRSASTSAGTPTAGAS